MDWEKAADVGVAVGMLPFLAWMALTSRLLSASGFLLLSLTAVLRLRSSQIRQWTDENQWKFLAILLPIIMLAVLGAMPTN